MALSLPAALRTTAVRLSALYLILFTACALALVFYMTSVSARMLTTQTMETITDEVGGLARAYQRGGLQLLVRTVAARSRQPGANLYLIADSQGRILSGNVESLEPGVLDCEGWTSRPFSYRRFGEGANEDREGDPDAGRGGHGTSGRRSGASPAQSDDGACRPRPARAGGTPRRGAARADSSRSA